MSRPKSALIFLLTLLLSSSVLSAIRIPELCLTYTDFSQITSIAVGYKYVYFATPHGLTRYEISEERWADPINPIYGLAWGRVHEIDVSFDDETIRVNTDMGTFEYTELSKDWSRIYEMPEIETRPYLPPAEEIFFAPWGYNYLPGAVLIGEHERRFPFSCMLDDNWGNIWIGISGLGAARTDDAGRHIKLLPFGLLQEDVTALTLDDDSLLWMCGRVENSFRTGITIFDRAGNEFSHVESYGGLLHRPDAVNDICAGREDIFAATDDGVWVIDRIEKKTRLLPGENNGLPDGAAFTLLMLGDTLLTGTEHGLVTTVVRGDTIETIYETILPSLAILSLKMVNDDLWIGTSQGAYRMDWQTGSIGLLSTSEITETGFVFDIEFDGQRVWLATEYELAAIDINSADIEVFPEVNNYGGARAVAVADTIVAVATVRGLLLLYTGESPQYEFFTDEDGLPSVNIRDLIFDEEYLWLATDRGLCRFWYTNPDL